MQGLPCGHCWHVLLQSRRPEGCLGGIYQDRVPCSKADVHPDQREEHPAEEGSTLHMSGRAWQLLGNWNTGSCYLCGKHTPAAKLS